LLWDTKNDLPVLFQDSIYPTSITPEMEKALNEASIQKARALNLPLLTINGGHADMYNGNATSFGSSCPFEYTDAAGGVTEGSYSIKDCQFLFSPEQTTLVILNQRSFSICKLFA